MKALRIGVVVWLVVLAGAQSALAAEGLLLRGANLKQSPRFLSATLKLLPPATRVVLGPRRGGWRRIKVIAGGDTGWVRDYKVRKSRPRAVAGTTTRPKKRTTSGGFSGFAGLSRGATGLFGYQPKATRSGTSTIGIRGLSAVDLSNARPNPAAMDTLDQIAVHPAEAETYAAKGGLRAVAIAYVQQAPAASTSGQTEDDDDQAGSDR